MTFLIGGVAKTVTIDQSGAFGQTLFQLGILLVLVVELWAVLAQCGRGGQGAVPAEATAGGREEEVCPAAALRAYFTLRGVALMADTSEVRLHTEAPLQLCWRLRRQAATELEVEEEQDEDL